jgi:hypothetical protein
MVERYIEAIFEAQETWEGAGVRLHRGFGYHELPRFDPFLLFDDFSSLVEADFLKGFPKHPHRGIETVTYVLQGEVTHRDSLGNAGTISDGDIQWMTAGSGIIHEEMPHGNKGLIGFQLWVNLPAAHKMMTPRYQEIKAHNIPVYRGDGYIVRIIAGTYKNIRGPVEDIMAHPAYFDVTLEAGRSLAREVNPQDTCFLYIINGTLKNHDTEYGHGTILLFSREGDGIRIQSGATAARFLFVSGTPLREPIAWHGPIVMNTPEEIHGALYDLENGTFIKH